MKIGYSPEPGERRTIVIVWEIDDLSKEGDRRYWWLEEEVECLRRHLPENAQLTGTPKGQSLASLQRRADRSEVELVHPDTPGEIDLPPSVRLPLDEWSDADPERTYLIISHHRRPTDDKQEAIKFPWPEEAEALRQEWLSTEAARDHRRSKKARRRFDSALEELGFRDPRDLSPWDPDKATELQPGIIVQDERPGRLHG